MSSRENKPGLLRSSVNSLELPKQECAIALAPSLGNLSLRIPQNPDLYEVTGFGNFRDGVVNVQEGFDADLAKNPGFEAQGRLWELSREQIEALPEWCLDKVRFAVETAQFLAEHDHPFCVESHKILGYALGSLEKGFEKESFQSQYTSKTEKIAGARLFEGWTETPGLSNYPNKRTFVLNPDSPEGVIYVDIYNNGRLHAVLSLKTVFYEYYNPDVTAYLFKPKKKAEDEYTPIVGSGISDYTDKNSRQFKLFGRPDELIEEALTTSELILGAFDRPPDEINHGNAVWLLRGQYVK